ncbi:serine protease, DegP [Dehalogenimonas lykanthroporepellens BL-DC-9]|jgi:serine protease Do|nr:serine protease, DegP [Dehalogenimonas lykanthroporepellens BL-DC-9]
MSLRSILTAAVVTVVIVGNAGIFATHAGIDQDIAAIEAKKSSLNATTTSLQSGIEALEQQLGPAMSQVALLSARVSELTDGRPDTDAGAFANLIESIDPVTVLVNAVGPGLRGYASGVIVGSDGYVLTVLHNVINANSISVTLNTGETYTATTVQINQTDNLALLKLDTSRTDLPVAILGSMSEVRTGEAVIAAGYPLNNDLPGPASFTYGIVSALRTSPDFYFIQSEVPIAQGSGGGGLFTMEGKVIGLASLAEAVGIYLFVPVDLADSLLELIPA